MAREQLKNLTEPMYYILLSLLRENHGYGIMQMVEELTAGRVVIGAGTLYSLLGRFEKEGIIEQTAEEKRRKIYRITEKGAGVLQEEYERLNHLVEDGKKFFAFEGQRKEPPENGGGGEKAEPSKEAEAAKGRRRAEKAAGAGADGREEKGRGVSSHKGLGYSGAF